MAKTTLILDSSQISCWYECPQQWYNLYVRRLIPVLRQPSDAMNAGTYGHKILDIYYRARVSGASLNQAAEQALAYNPDIDTCECGCGKEFHKHIEALNVEECHHCGHCLRFRPRPFELAKDVRSTVQNRLREYFFNYQVNDFIPTSPQHVEVGFSEPIYEDKDNLFVLEGRLDLIGTLQGLNCIVDHKFQMRMHQLYNKSIQFRNYALIGKALVLIINYIRLAKATNKDTLVREPVTFSVPELYRWKSELIRTFFDIKNALATGDLEKRWTTCGPYSGHHKYQCMYTQLCEEYNNDVVRIKERQLYQVNPIQWRPW